VDNRAERLPLGETAKRHPAAHRRTWGHDNEAGWVNTVFLRLVGLPATDIKQIEVFLRFAGRTADFQWVSSAADTIDLQLESAPLEGEAPTRTTTGPGQPALHGWILDRGQKAPDNAAYVLRRPLQIDGFTALLRACELQIARATASPPTSRLDAAATAPFLDDGRRTTYRLVRWPGSDLLRGKPKFVRMLGFLSNRPLSLARLKVLSGMDEASCRELLGMLDQRGLLIRGETRPDAAPALVADTVPCELSPGAVGVATIGGAREAASAGLFSRLRMRLGLT
jgi:hypothetical protein